MSPSVACRLALVTGLTLGLLTLPGLALAIGPVAWAAEPETQTVTFTATGAPPTACGTRPDLSGLSVPEGTAVVVANRTGVPASVVVNGGTVLSVPDGEGVALTLAPGQHHVRLVPECGVVAATLPLAVMVTASGPPPTSPTTGTTAPPTASGPATAGPAAATSAPARPGRAGGADPGPRATDGEPAPVPAATDPSDPSDPSSTDAAAGPSPPAVVAGVISARPVTLTGEGHPKGLRLLAAVATICVLGVTVAIIRAIVRLSPYRA